MSICILQYQEKLPSSRKSVLGVYSSPLKAWEIFKSRLQQGRTPYTGGIFHYTSAETLSYAMAQNTSSSIRIYNHEMFDVFIVWNVLDRSLK